VKVARIAGASRHSRLETEPTLSAIGWYQKGPCVNYDYTIKIKKKLKITLKLCTRILKEYKREITYLLQKLINNPLRKYKGN